MSYETFSRQQHARLDDLLKPEDTEYVPVYYRKQNMPRMSLYASENYVIDQIIMPALAQSDTTNPSYAKTKTS